MDLGPNGKGLPSHGVVEEMVLRKPFCVFSVISEQTDWAAGDGLHHQLDGVNEVTYLLVLG